LENVFLVIAKSFLARIFVMGSAETSRGLWLGWQWADGTIGLGVQCKNVIQPRWLSKGKPLFQASCLVFKRFWVQFSALTPAVFILTSFEIITTV
jgi:hypothetical protein